MIVLHLEVTTGFRAFSAMLDLQQCRKLEGGCRPKVFKWCGRFTAWLMLGGC
jgi:hypothetical protein